MSAIKELTLYTFYYSSAAYRIRSFLAYRNIPYKCEYVHLLKGEQHSDEFVSINPMHQIPAMKVELENGETHILTQSLAIIQYLDSQYPGTPIYPEDPILRAKSVAIADTISGGIQPLQNHETVTFYKEPLGDFSPIKPEERLAIIQYWIKRKLENLDKLVKKTAGKFCVGDQLTIADFSLVPQMFNARRFEVDTTKYPTLKAIDDVLQEMEIFKIGHPMACPDAPKEN